MTETNTLYITEQTQLNDFCTTLSGAAFITVDTEFLRERTYYPKLCLLQVAGPTSAACIDPLVDNLDLSPLYAVLHDASIMKVFHAGRQDLEIFYNATNRLPAPLADTQIMAMVCGFGESVSYETLASKLAKAKIDKSSRFTDWSARPLTQKQIDYALADVTHLRVVYEKLHAMLIAKNRQDWITDELAALLNMGNYNIDLDQCWQRLRMRIDKPRLQLRIQKLAAWREREAQTLNIPRGRVLKDETLQEIALNPPRDMAQLLRTRGLPGGFADSRFASAILQLIAEVEAAPESALPVLEKSRQNGNESTGATVELLKVLLRQCAAEHDVASKLLATSDDLDALACNDSAAIPALQGWRFDVFGKHALALKQGKLALTLQNHKIVVTAVE